MFIQPVMSSAELQIVHPQLVMIYNRSAMVPTLCRMTAPTFNRKLLPCEHNFTDTDA